MSTPVFFLFLGSLLPHAFFLYWIKQQEQINSQNNQLFDGSIKIIETLSRQLDEVLGIQKKIVNRITTDAVSDRKDGE